MKEYKETYCDIEYHVIEVYDQEIKGSQLVEYTKLYKYVIIRKFDSSIPTWGSEAKLIKEMIFKDGKIHNEHGRAIMKIKTHSNSIITWDQTLNSFYLNSEQFSDEDKFKNEIRKIRLDETLQD